VKEFYLGLFHEGIKEANYRKRLETAFQSLKPFCPYSNYAALICAYFLFRVNSFERVAALTEIPTLSRIARFFATPFEQCVEKAAQPVSRHSSSSTEILVSNRDFELIRGTISFLDRKFKDCAKHLASCRKASISGLDPQGDDRQTLLEARLARVTKQPAEARRLYSRLENCPTRQLQSPRFRAGNGTPNVFASSHASPEQLSERELGKKIWLEPIESLVPVTI
jgi:hypothetical protein